MPEKDNMCVHIETKCMCLCVHAHTQCCTQSLSCVLFIVTPWTVVCSSVHGILQARILEWVSISFSRGSSQPRDRTALEADALTSEPRGYIQNQTLDLHTPPLWLHPVPVNDHSIIPKPWLRLVPHESYSIDQQILLDLPSKCI